MECAFPRRFDVRREHAGGRLRGTGRDRPFLEDRRTFAAPRELSPDRQADDAAANDDGIPLVVHPLMIAVHGIDLRARRLHGRKT